MKLFKLIMNCVIASLLILSVALNIFVFSVLGIGTREGFKQALLAKELMTELSSVETTMDEIVPEETKASNLVEETTPEVSTEPVEYETDCDTSDIAPIYQDENVKITYLRQEPCEMTCLSYSFLIENTSDRPLTITFSEVYIDGFKVDLSGLTCENLAIGGKSVENLHLYQQEWEDFTTNPSRVEFRVRLINPKSLLNIYDSDVVTFDL